MTVSFYMLAVASNISADAAAAAVLLQQDFFFYVNKGTKNNTGGFSLPPTGFVKSLVVVC